MEEAGELSHAVKCWIGRGDLIEMLFFDRRKGKERRSGKDRRELEDPDYWRREKRSGKERRKDKDRRSGVDRRTGRYHRLPEEQKKALDEILANVERLL
jgi:hypothetical protein